MATKKDIKELLNKMGITESEMDAYWNDLADVNWKVKAINKCGKSWRDLGLSVIAEIPTQKQRDIEAKIREQKEAEKKAEAERKLKEERAYYEKHFEEIMLQKIDSKENLTEDELKRLALEYDIEREEGENRRWTRTVSSYVELGGRYFCIDWENGLTESQPNEFPNQPVEVKKHSYEKTITVNEWRPV